MEILLNTKPILGPGGRFIYVTVTTAQQFQKRNGHYMAVSEAGGYCINL
jgi:hypothetical protein